MKFEKEIDDLSEKLEVLEVIVQGQYDKKITGNAKTSATGTIDGHFVEVKGLVERKGIHSDDPPGPCHLCTAMIFHGST